MPNKKILYVEWVDAVAAAGWQNQEALKAHKCQSCGFLIAETPKEITLALTVSESEMNAIMCIPKQWITKRRRIKI